MPVLAPFVPYIAAAAGVTGAAGIIINAKAERDAANFNRQVTDQNAQIAGDQGRMAADAQRRKAYMALSNIRANQGSSGIGLEGSALDILGESAANAAYDQLNIGYQTELNKRGFRNDSSLSKAQAANALGAGTYLSAASQLGAGASNAYMLSRK
ncbi:MAG: hypothetical protein K2X36_11755 [Microbacteriaceae bacterium]|nr:hypothetical protein [Microbacteriaceae bacterium]